MDGPDDERDSGRRRRRSTARDGAHGFFLARPVVQPSPARSAAGAAARPHRGDRSGRRGEHPGPGSRVHREHDRQRRLHRFRAGRGPGVLADCLVARAGRVPARRGRRGPGRHAVPGSRGRLLAVVTTTERVLLAAAVVIAAVSGEPFAATQRDLIVLVRSTTVTSTSAPPSPRVTFSPPNPPPTITTRCFPVIVIVPPLPSRPAPDKRGRRQRAVSCSSRSCSRPGGWLPARAEVAGAHRTRARAG